MTKIRDIRRHVALACASMGLMAVSTGVLAQAQNAPAKPAACDPYKDYSCLDSYLGTGFWERLSNYYSLEYGQAAAPADPKAPPSRRDDVAPGAQTIPP
ncbi:MAG: hypothetical protein JO269_05215, partial [Burkholderiaceae bacterium]|nr:hypothetical protein [Burkholderiaceae bacterium]